MENYPIIWGMKWLGDISTEKPIKHEISIVQVESSNAIFGLCVCVLFCFDDQPYTSSFRKVRI